MASMRLPARKELEVSRLGRCAHPSPLTARGERFVDEKARVLASSDARDLQACTESGEPVPSFEPAGPRSELFFAPAATACGIVTCGGLCPGTNNVIRSLVMTLHYGYGVDRILGFRYGYAGLSPASPSEPIVLSPEQVKDVHHHGGTLLGTSRGPQDVAEMVDQLVRLGVGILFVIGGDGTLRGASALVEEIESRELSIGVVGVPKTIDNDLHWIERSFGFATAVEEARRAIRAAHSEARGAWNGIGLVKLMGRYSGFIAAHASLANSDVNFCLLPEVPFALAGESGFLHALQDRLAAKQHAVVVVAEGACQELMRAPGDDDRDASGNLRLQDVGPFLADHMEQYFARAGVKISIKYIDPSYTVRGLPANSLDAELTLMLGQHAAHAGMAGRTDMMVGHWNQRFTHVPLRLATLGCRQVDPGGRLWRRVLEATGQPAAMFTPPAT